MQMSVDLFNCRSGEACIVFGRHNTVNILFVKELQINQTKTKKSEVKKMAKTVKTGQNQYVVAAP